MDLLVCNFILAPSSIILSVMFDTPNTHSSVCLNIFLAKKLLAPSTKVHSEPSDY